MAGSFQIYASDRLLSSYQKEQQAYAKGWEYYNEGKTDVYLITPQGYRYTFAKHPNANPLKKIIIDEKHSIMGESDATWKQMVQFVKKVNPTFNEQIARTFLEVGKIYGVRGDIAFSQSIHETDYFRFTGDVKPYQNNFAGIGATGGGKQGHSFPTIKEGVTAQIQHLFAYASTSDIPHGEHLVDPRFHLVKRGSAPYWEDLAGKWAYPGYNTKKFESLEAAMRNGESYGQRIIKLFEEMKGADTLDKKRAFKPYSLQEFRSYLNQRVNVERKINHIQIHHTWIPRKTDYAGESTIIGMWKYHTETRGWDDIAQHFTIAPDGTIWDGRSLDKDPAGIRGHNDGGLMFEMIGNFDKGEETLEDKQLEAVIGAVRACMKKFNLQADDIVFHREHADKSCPGTGIDKKWFLKKIEGGGTVEYDGYPPETPSWKKEAVQWLFDEGLLKGESWKKELDQPLPLWAEAIVLKRLYEMLNK